MWENLNHLFWVNLWIVDRYVSYNEEKKVYETNVTLNFHQNHMSLSWFIDL